LESCSSSSEIGDTLQAISKLQGTISAQQQIVEDAAKKVAEIMGEIAVCDGHIAWATSVTQSKQEYEKVAARLRDEAAQRRDSVANDLRTMPTQTHRHVRSGGWWFWRWEHVTTVTDHEKQSRLQSLQNDAKSEIDALERKIGESGKDKAEAARVEAEAKQSKIGHVTKLTEQQKVLTQQTTILATCYKNLGDMEAKLSSRCSAYGLANSESLIRLLSSMESLALQAAIKNGGVMSYAGEVNITLESVDQAMDWLALDESKDAVLIRLQLISDALVPASVVIEEMQHRINNYENQTPMLTNKK